MTRTLLVPDDFSTCADLAFAHARHLADHFGAVLHVLHVADPPPPDAAEARRALDAAAERRTYAKAWAHRTPLVYAEVESDSPADAIVDYARRRGTGLIVMGAYGRDGMQQRHLGRTADAVVRRASCPVLTVRPRPVPFAHATIRRVLVPFDFSVASRSALQHAGELARAYDARLAVLHVIDAPARSVPGRPTHSPMSVAQARTRSAGVALAAEVQAAGVQATVHVAAGDPSLAVVAFAEQSGTDLIVVAPHGAAGGVPRIPGHTSERIVRLAPCPVLVTKRLSHLLATPEHAAPARAATHDVADRSGW